MIDFFLELKGYLPLPFFKSRDGPKIFDAMLLRTERGVDGKLPPKMSLLPPPGGFRTLQRKEGKISFEGIFWCEIFKSIKIQFMFESSSTFVLFERFSFS